MDNISEPREIVSVFFKGNKARVDCFSQMLLALFAVRTVNLREIAVAFASPAQIDSRYKRVKRFFAQIKLERYCLAQWIFKLFFNQQSKVYLTIDRTNWFWGKAKINLLMIGIAYEGLAIPVCWRLLNKAGNATAEEHKTIINGFVKSLGKDCILGVLGDREFASGALFRWLNQHNIPFYIRIKENTQVFVRKQKCCPMKKLFRGLSPKTARPFMMAVWLFKEKIYVAGSRSERGELMIVATNQDPKNAIPVYLRRWEIESLFQGLKTRGFRFEETHLAKPERIETLMFLLAVGFCWAHKVGEWRTLKKPIVLNRYRASRRPQYSYFRYGFDWLRDIILHLAARTKELRTCLQQLILPKTLQQEEKQ
jgi:hypothetical protein